MSLSELEKKILMNLNTDISGSTDYDVIYNLNVNRRNILSVCDIKKEDKCLDLNPELGAITRGLASISNLVDCYSNDENKNEVLRRRLSNVRIFESNDNLSNDYDKIFIIGRIPTNEDFEIIKRCLKPRGTFFVAVDNKYAMKYFSGAYNDLTGKRFDSITEKLLMSNVELRNLINENGYKAFFYYPLPDFRFSNVIYSDEYLPKAGDIYNLGHSLDKKRFILFDEAKALSEAASSGKFETFTNSYLVKCTK